MNIIESIAGELKYIGRHPIDTVKDFGSGFGAGMKVMRHAPSYAYHKITGNEFGVAKDSVKAVGSVLPNAVSVAGRRVKNIVKDTISDNPKTAAAVAGASGVLGAGLMAKKYLASKMKK